MVTVLYTLSSVKILLPSSKIDRCKWPWLQTSMPVYRADKINVFLKLNSCQQWLPCTSKCSQAKVLPATTNTGQQRQVAVEFLTCYMQEGRMPLFWLWREAVLLLLLAHNTTYQNTLDTDWKPVIQNRAECSFKWLLHNRVCNRSHVGANWTARTLGKS